MGHRYEGGALVDAQVMRLCSHRSMQLTGVSSERFDVLVRRVRMRRPDINQLVQNTIDILIVDPIATDAKKTSTALRRRLRDISIVRVMHADQALRLMFDRGLFTVEPQLPRLILLDSRAILDGKGFLTRIRTDRRAREIPVIVLSKDGEPSNLADSQSVGVVAHVVKSVGQAEYESEVERIAYMWLDHVANQTTERHHKKAAMWA